MKEQDLTKLTVDELKAKQKTHKTSSILILIAMAIMLLSGIFFMLKIKSPVFYNFTGSIFAFSYYFL